MSMPSEVIEWPAEDLLVFELNGTPRSGKGTIATHLAETYPEDVRVEETGIHYRGYARTLHDAGIINPDMPKEQIIERIASISEGALEDMGSDRDAMVKGFSQQDLYGHLTSRIVPAVGQVDAIRHIVKDSLRDRVGKIIADGRYRGLILDGRNLSPVIRDITGLSMVLRTFVWCMPGEAAYRQAAQTGVDPDQDPEAFARIHDDAVNRFHEDESRPIDPVRADDDAISYWTDKQVNVYSEGVYGDLLRDNEFLRAMTSQERREYIDGIKFSAGTLAVRTGRQIKFDTTPFRALTSDPKNLMLRAARIMFCEAAAEHVRRAA